MAAKCHLLDPAEAARRSRFSLKTIYRAIHAGELRAHKVRSRWRIAVSDLDEWLVGNHIGVVTPRRSEAAVGSRAALRDIEADAA